MADADHRLASQFIPRPRSPPLFTVRSFDLGKIGEEAAMTEDKIYVSILVGAPTVCFVTHLIPAAGTEIKRRDAFLRRVDLGADSPLFPY